MEELKLHSKGSEAHLEAIENAFKAFKSNLKSNTELTSAEKEVELSKAKKSFLMYKRQWRNKLF